MEAWRNGISQAAVQAVQILLDDNIDFLKSAADVKELIGEYLSKAKVDLGLDVETCAYQWAEWLNNGAERKVGCSL